ncbi:MAG: DNA-3-methyladenine glycosylase [Bacteroidetes bacterium]|nr:MAG: DNA-3-methyladenine glycosylase [Bacteroidota bacterium]
MKSRPNKLPLSFYLQESVTLIARGLIGMRLCSFKDDVITSGIIVETEAYEGITDKASHAYNNRRTARTEIMFQKGGVAYVYLCYGMHHLFNVVTNIEGVPHAVLIRAIFPTDGIDTMKQRTAKQSMGFKATNGPGKLAKALGIHTSDTGENLTGNKIWIEKTNIQIKQGDIVAGPRIGVGYAGEDALLPYRFMKSLI